MEIRQLRYFLKVAETLNFSEASRRLYVTQSTLSQQIGRLEQEVGLQLFERNSHEVFLTEAGKELLPYARRAVIATDSCLDHIVDLKKMLTGELNIGVTFSFSTIMMDTLLDFMHTYPGVKLYITYCPMEELMDLLKERKLDFVLAFRPLKKDKDIDNIEIFTNHLSAIVNSNHQLAGRKSITLADLQKYDMVLPSRGMQARQALDKLLADKEIELRLKMEANNVDIIFKLLRRSNLVTVLAESTVVHEDDLTAIPIDEPQNKMEGCIHILKDSYMKNSAQVFINMLRNSTTVMARKALNDMLK